MEVGKVYTETRMWLDEELENWSFEEMLLDDKHHVAVALGDTNTNREQTSKNVKRSVTPFTVLTYKDLMASAVPLSDEDPTYWDSFTSKQELPQRQSAKPSSKS